MRRELLLMRHAKSSHDDIVGSDFDRPLSRRGIKDALLVGSSLLADELLPDHLISSPAKRTRQTALLICENLQIPEKSIIYKQQLYHCELEDLLEIIRHLPDDTHRPLIIGHNPSLESLLVFLCGENLPYPAKGKLLTTASIAHIKMPGDWHALAQSCARLVRLIRPKSLRSGD